MDDPGEMTFEAALGHLEGVVDDLERGDSELSEALQRYGIGVQLLARCRGLLEGAERWVALLTGVDAAGTPTTAPFDAAATATAPRESNPGAGPSAALDDDAIPY